MSGPWHHHQQTPHRSQSTLPADNVSISMNQGAGAGGGSDAYGGSCPVVPPMPHPDCHPSSSHRRFHAYEWHPLRYVPYVLAIIVVVGLPLQLYIYSTSHSQSSPRQQHQPSSLARQFPLLGDFDGAAGAVDQHASTRRAQPLHCGYCERQIVVVDVSMPDGAREEAMLRHPRTGGLADVRVSSFIDSHLTCLLHGGEVLTVKGSRATDGLWYGIREHRQSGTAYVELHGGDIGFQDVVWCRLYVVVMPDAPP